MKESLKVLQECAEIQAKKSNDYQNPNSRIVQADYYPRGVMSIMELIHTKTIRVCGQYSKLWKTILTTNLTLNQSKTPSKI